MSNRRHYGPRPRSIGTPLPELPVCEHGFQICEACDDDVPDGLEYAWAFRALLVENSMPVERRTAADRSEVAS